MTIDHMRECVVSIYEDRNLTNRLLSRNFPWILTHHPIAAKLFEVNQRNHNRTLLSARIRNIIEQEATHELEIYRWAKERNSLEI